MNKNELTTINVSLKQKEKQEIVETAVEEGYSTTSAFLVDRAKNQIKIEAVYNGFRELVIEINRIGTNINQIVREMRYSNYFTDDQVYVLENEVKKLNQFIKKERNKLKDDERYFFNFSFDNLKDHVNLQNSKLEQATKVNNILDSSINLIVDFINILENESFEKIYIDYFYEYIEKLNYKQYDYEEAFKMFEDINNQVRNINQRLINPENKIEAKDFREMRKIINKHRK